MALNQLNGELERKNSDHEEEITRLQASSKKLNEDVSELMSTIDKLKTTLHAKSEELQTKVSITDHPSLGPKPLCSPVN